MYDVAESKDDRHENPFASPLKEIRCKDRPLHHDDHKQELLEKQTSARNRPREPVLPGSGYRLKMDDRRNQKHAAEKRENRNGFRKHFKHSVFAE